MSRVRIKTCIFYRNLEYLEVWNTNYIFQKLMFSRIKKRARIDEQSNSLLLQEVSNEQTMLNMYFNVFFWSEKNRAAAMRDITYSLNRVL